MKNTGCKRSLFAAVVLLVAFACEPVPDDVFVRHFTMKKGNHYSTPRIVETLQSERLVAEATFYPSAIYDFGDIALQSNKNKLIGFSDCNSSHHRNSARFAWQWFDNRLEIYAYCYVDGIRVEQFLDTVAIGTKNTYELVLKRDRYLFYLNGSPKATIKRSDHLCHTGAYYLLFPYFGGSLAAPHDITIDLAILP